MRPLVRAYGPEKRLSALSCVPFVCLERPRKEPVQPRCAIAQAHLVLMRGRLEHDAAAAEGVEVHDRRWLQSEALVRRDVRVYSSLLGRRLLRVRGHESLAVDVPRCVRERLERPMARLRRREVEVLLVDEDGRSPPQYRGCQLW